MANNFSSSPLWLCIGFCITALAITAGCKTFLASKEPLPIIEGAFYVGSDTCITCHDDVYEGYKKTVHFRLHRAELGDKTGGCEACHGPGSKHINDEHVSDYILSFSRLSANQGSQICLSCHQGSPVMNWQANSHSLNDVGCNDCHKSHKISTPKMVHLGDPEICFSCHQGTRAQLMLPSHHPINEKKMKCGSCHENHGSENNNLKGETLNDVCSECHAEYQGPFAFEHPPVVEDCSICHDPHGTIANNLLKQGQPFLCLRCHIGHKGNNTTGSHASFLTSCTQCHSQVHGSDLPSQVHGGGLTR